MGCRKTGLGIILVFLLLASCQRVKKPLSPAKEIGELFAALEKEGLFNGVVLVAEKGEVLYRQAFGFSNFETGERLEADAVFELASISKTLTAVAIHMLVEQGLLRLDDNLTRFFPKLPYDRVTIGGLLSHTSGLFDVYGEVELRKKFYAFYNKTEPAYTNKDYLAFLEQFKPQLIGQPGEKSHYSNTAYVLLALIVEQVSGQEFDAFLREHIFEPAEMRHTVVYSKLKDRSVANLISGYRHDPVDGIVPEPDPDAGPSIHGLTYGDDEIVSTVDDLLAYDQALRSGRLLKPATLDRILVPPTLTDGRVSPYALGFGVTNEDGLRYVFHGGSTAGFWSYCKFSRPENDNTVILFTNVKSTRSTFRAIPRAINQILRGQPYQIPKPSIIYPLARAIEKNGAAATYETFDRLQATGNYLVEVSHLNQLGAHFARLKKSAAARALFELSLRLEPGNEAATRALAELN